MDLLNSMILNDAAVSFGDCGAPSGRAAAVVDAIEKARPGKGIAIMALAMAIYTFTLVIDDRWLQSYLRADSRQEFLPVRQRPSQ